MKTALLFIAASTITFAQPSLERGKTLFARTCGAGYCHATEGVGGGAPRLAARGFEQEYIQTTVTNGVPGTQMAAYGASLPPTDLAAVVNYVASLNGVAVTGTRLPAGASKRTFTGEAARGKALFSEATRGFARCATCHLANGVGISVTTPLARIPANAAALQALATPSIVTVTAAGETMPALIVARRSQSITFYDLTSLPPVLRTVNPDEFRSVDGSPWRHAAAIGTYTSAELTSILTYLRAVAAR